MPQHEMVIDSHVHLSKSNRDHPDFAGVRDALLADMAHHHIARAVVFPDSEPNTAVTDLYETLSLVADTPELSMVGTVHIPAIDAAVVARLDGLVRSGKILGVKLYPGFEHFYPMDRRCHAVYRLCARHDIPVIYHSGESSYPPECQRLNHPYEIAKVAERFPALKIVIAHFSQPHLSACRDVVLQYPNVHVDISGLAYPGVVEECGEGIIHRVLTDVATRQPEKILFGTDWPICDIGAHLSLVRDLRVSDGAKDLILHGNAERLFRFGLAEDERGSVSCPSV